MGTANDSRADVAVRGLVQRTRQAIFLGVALRWSGIGFLVFGSAVLLGRTLLSFDPPVSAVWLIPLAFALPAAWIAASRRGMSASAAAAWVDVRAGGGGLVVTGLEVPDPRWKTTFDTVVPVSGAVPRLRIARPATWSACAAAFLAAALWVEIPEPTPGPSPELFEAIVSGLREKLETLDETVTLDADLAEELVDRLERLEALVADASPESIFEAIDALEERLAREGQRVAEMLADAGAELAAVGLDALRNNPEAFESLERALSALRAAGIGKNLPEELRDTFGQDLQLPEGAELSSSELMKLSAALGELARERFGALAGAGLLKPSLLREASKFASLASFLQNDHVCDETCAEGGT